MPNILSFLLILLISPLVHSATTSIPSTGIPPRISEFSGLTSLAYKLYSFGGRDLEGELTNEIREFDLSIFHWTILQTNTQLAPSPRMNSVVTSYNGNIYVFGGQDSTGLREELWQYNIAAESWIQLPIVYCAPIARTQTAFTLAGNLLFAFGGVTNSGPDSSLLL